MLVLCDEHQLGVAHTELLTAQVIVLPTDHRCMRNVKSLRVGPASPAEINFVIPTTSYPPVGLLQSSFVVCAVVGVRSLSSVGYTEK